jgi:hypothetical protein
MRSYQPWSAIKGHEITIRSLVTELAASFCGEHSSQVADLVAEKGLAISWGILRDQIRGILGSG